MSRIFVGRKKLTTEKNPICGTFLTDAAVSENLIHFGGGGGGGGGLNHLTESMTLKDS